MENFSDTVYEGKFIHETTYPQRAEKFEEIELDGIKVDFFDPKEKIIHETKKSDKMEEAHEWQLKYYIYVFENNGITGVKGRLEYPKLKETKEIELTEKDKTMLEEIKENIKNITSSDTCPEKIQSRICKKCAYHDFCYVNERDE